MAGQQPSTVPSPSVLGPRAGGWWCAAPRRRNLSTEHHWSSEHRVVVGARLRERLKNVPVLDDLAVLKPEEVGGDCAGVLGRGLDQPVGDDDVALGDHTLDFDAQLGELPRECQDSPGTMAASIIVRWSSMLGASSNAREEITMTARRSGTTVISCPYLPCAL